MMIKFLYTLIVFRTLWKPSLELFSDNMFSLGR